MQCKGKIFINLFYTFFFIVSLNYIFINFFKKWEFTKPIYNNTFWALHYSLTISVIAFLIISLFRKLKVGCLTMLSLICILIFMYQFNPIDTYEYPHDVKVLSKNGNEKIVVRESKSGKTNEIKVDTVKVVDKFIFRKLLQK